MNGHKPMIGRRVATAAGALALALALAGCGGSAASGAAAGEMNLKATDFAYAPAKANLSGPGQIKVTLQNQGLVEHDFTIEGVQGQLLVKPNTTGTATFAIPKAGTYTYTCTVQGHKEAGMKGTLTVG